jgi:hypothetical protein
MGSLAGYIAAICMSVAATYLSQFVLPKVKIRYWLPNHFMYSIPASQISPQQPAPPTLLAAPPLKLLTHAVIVQNFGRQTAPWVEIVHRRRPDFFQFYPSLDYTESTTPAGEHVLRINSVARKEWFTIQFLSWMTMPEFLYIRSTAGHASLMPWMYVRRYPQWVYHFLRALVVMGIGFCTYWLIKAGFFVFQLMHAR